MAIHIHDRHFVKDPLTPIGESGQKEVMEYYVDDPSDFASLPTYPEIARTSSAYCPRTDQSKVLMTSGWEDV